MTYTPVRSSRHTSDVLERAARRVFRPLCGSLAIFTLFFVWQTDQRHPTLYDAARWTTTGLTALWFLLALFSALTDRR
jgi:hypothetical protein